MKRKFYLFLVKTEEEGYKSAFIAERTNKRELNGLNMRHYVGWYRTIEEARAVIE